MVTSALQEWDKETNEEIESARENPIPFNRQLLLVYGHSLGMAILKYESMRVQIFIISMRI